MGGTQSAAAPGRRLRIVRPGTALSAGILTVLMLAASAAVSASARELRLSGLGEAALWLSFGPVGVVWIRPGSPG